MALTNQVIRSKVGKDIDKLILVSPNALDYKDKIGEGLAKGGAMEDSRID